MKSLIKDEPLAIEAAKELGAYESLWDSKVASFKQYRDLLRETKASFPSQLVDDSVALDYLERSLRSLRESQVGNVGAKIEGTADYPERLLDGKHPASLLYYQGDWGLVERRGVSIVGTRKPSAEGVARAKKVAKLLAEKGFVIYSGLAKGIDTAAHRSAIDNGGRTVAVIGTPIVSAYPKENRELQRQIARDHLLISQIPLVRQDRRYFKSNKVFFVERNKTMAALSEATVVVEASETSGTLTQAKATLAMGRKLFILNSCFEDSRITWPAKLEAQGGIRVREFGDIEAALG